MAKTKILFNAAQEEGLRVAIVDENNKIRDLISEHPEKEEKIHNIYKGVVTGVETSLNAVFVNYGAEKHGFLPIKDIAPYSIYQDVTIEEVGESKNEEDVSPDSERPGSEEEDWADHRSRASQVRIEDIKVGQELLVQVGKEERDRKGAALTNFLSLAGRYLVLMPGSAAGGVSRRVEGADRSALKDSLRQLNKPKGMGVIIRTSGVNKTQEELQWDLDMLLEQWAAIKDASLKHKAPHLIFQESGIINRIIRDYLSQDVDQIIADDLVLYEKLKEQIAFIRPKFLEKLSFYNEEKPIFSKFGDIENQIQQAHESSVRLASGGSIVINRTEALFSIDVNSARATRGSGIEETALQINLEAADEIARQLRLRDIGGLIVIDFIDMLSVQHQKEVEARLRNALRADRARVQIGRISRFGLLEMSRQRLKSSLSEETQVICPRCKGEGHVRSVHSIALSLLRVIEEDAIKGQIAKIQLQVPVDMAAFFLNEKRKKLVEIEEKYQVKVVVLPNLNLHSPHYHIKREKGAVSEESVGRLTKSYETLEAYEEVALSGVEGQKKTSRQPSKPAVEFMVSRPAPAPASEKSPGFLKRLLGGIFGFAKTEVREEKPHHRGRASHPRHRSGGFAKTDESGRRQNAAHAGSGQHRGGGRRPYRGRTTRKPL